MKLKFFLVVIIIIPSIFLAACEKTVQSDTVNNGSISTVNNTATDNNTNETSKESIKNPADSVVENYDNALVSDLNNDKSQSFDNLFTGEIAEGEHQKIVEDLKSRGRDFRVRGSEIIYLTQFKVLKMLDERKKITLSYKDNNDSTKILTLTFTLRVVEYREEGIADTVDYKINEIYNIKLSPLSSNTTVHTDSGDIRNFYGVYAFYEENYLWPLSSDTKDYNNQNLKGTKYTIEKDLFKVEAPDFKFEVEYPKYIKEKIPDKFDEFYKVSSFFITEGIKYQFTIYDKDGNTSGWRLYISSESVWISTHNKNNGLGDPDVIVTIDKITKY